MKETIDYLIANGFLYAPIVLVIILGGHALTKVVNEVLSIDVKKNKREHSRYQMELLKALRERRDQNHSPTLLPEQSDSADVKVIKEEYWRSHGVSVAAIESFKKEHEMRTLMPITAIKSFAKGEKALVTTDDKVTAVKYTKTSTAFLMSAGISYVLIIVLFILGIKNRLSGSPEITGLDFAIILLTISLMLSLFISYITFDKFRKNLNAQRFLRLVKTPYKIKGLK